MQQGLPFSISAFSQANWLGAIVKVKLMTAKPAGLPIRRGASSAGQTCKSVPRSSNLQTGVKLGLAAACEHLRTAVMNYGERGEVQQAAVRRWWQILIRAVSQLECPSLRPPVNQLPVSPDLHRPTARHSGPVALSQPILSCPYTCVGQYISTAGSSLITMLHHPVNFSNGKM